MRHSSWTLFLVPLALALVVMLLPGATTSPDLPDPVGRAVFSQSLEESLPRPETPAPASGSAEEVTQSDSEALYKD